MCFDFWWVPVPIDYAPYPIGTVDGIVKKNFIPGKLFFLSGAKWVRPSLSSPDNDDSRTCAGGGFRASHTALIIVIIASAAGGARRQRCRQQSVSVVFVVLIPRCCRCAVAASLSLSTPPQHRWQPTTGVGLSLLVQRWESLLLVIVIVFTPCHSPPLLLPTAIHLRRSRWWLVVVSSVAPLPAAVFSAVRICPPHHCAIVDAFVACHCPLLRTIASRCPVALLTSVDCLCRSCWWLVVAFSARPAAYQPHPQAENVYCFHTFVLVSVGLVYV